MDIAKIRKKIKQEKEDRDSRPAPVSSVQGQPEEQQTPEAQETSPAVEKAELPVADKEEISEIIIETAQKPIQPPAAQKTAPEEKTPDIVELLTFYLSSEEFAFRLSDIEEIVRYQSVTFVPKTPEYIIGVTSLRGKIIPVVDLRQRLLLKNNAQGQDARKKVLILKGERGHFGALVDRVKGVIRIAPSDINEPPSHLSEEELMFIEGVVLNANRFISVVRRDVILDAVKFS